MSLRNTLLREVSGSIARIVLGFWIRDPSLLADAGADLTSLLGGKTEDLLAQRRGARQFEEIGERIAESLHRIFEQEYTHLDAGSQTTVALAVGQVLKTTPIAADLLVRQRLDPVELSDYLRERGAHEARLFSQDETELYRRIIYETSSYIVDTAAQLPAFTERSFAEVLTSQDRLIAAVERVLAEVEQFRAQSRQHNPDQQAAQFETEYYRALVRKLDQFNLIGVDLASSNRRYRLSVAYITLEMRREIRPGADEFDEAAPDELLATPQVLAQAQRLLIRGIAGSGKTTLLQWVAVCAADRTFPPKLAAWNDAIPFFIRLREHATSSLPAPEAFPRTVAPMIADTMPPGWVHRQLEAGRAIVLIDGVDELPEDERPGLRAWLEDLIATYPDARYLVTARPHAVPDAWMRDQDFQHAELQDMELPAVYQFIAHWHKAVREEVQTPEEADELEELQAKLKEELRRNRPIRNLATNPLLCAMICALHRDRKRQLPADRVQLYEITCEMLLERRDQERGVDLQRYPRLTYRQKKQFLQEFAYWMLRNGKTEADRAEAEACFARMLPTIPESASSVQPGDVYRLFIERSGMVREPGQGRIDFIHRTFLEFFAAHAAMENDDIGLLVSQSHLDQWRETVILAAGIGSQKQSSALIRGVLARGDQEPEQRHQLHLLAIAALNTAVTLDPEVIQQVKKRIAQIIPPANKEEARALAQTGELALPYLAFNPAYTARQSMACIHALGMIGGDGALDVLESYRSERRVTVVRELFKASVNFDMHEYGQQILQPVASGLTVFSFTEVLGKDIPLDIVAYCTDLQELDLCDTWVVNLNPLASLTGLQRLFLHNTQVAALSPLANLTSLQLLNLNNTQVADLTPLATLTSLQWLELNNTQVVDLSPLANLTSLQELYLDNTQVADLSPLATLTNLRRLDLNKTPVADLSPLANLTSLQWLDLNKTPVADLSPLAHLTSLQWLTLHNTHVTDLSPLNRLTKLTIFGVQDNRWRK